MATRFAFYPLILYNHAFYGNEHQLIITKPTLTRTNGTDQSFANIYTSGKMRGILNVSDCAYYYYCTTGCGSRAGGMSTEKGHGGGHGIVVRHPYVPI